MVSTVLYQTLGVSSKDEMWFLRQLLHLVFGIVLINSVHYYRSFITGRAKNIKRELKRNDMITFGKLQKVLARKKNHHFDYNFKFLLQANYFHKHHFIGD